MSNQKAEQSKVDQDERRNRTKVQAWTAAGAMSLDAIFARFDQSITDSLVFTPEELAAIQSTFGAISDSKGRVDKPTFTTSVLAKTGLEPALADAIHILFDCLCYLSKVPFQTPSPPPAHLTLNETKRALMWLLPSRASPVMTETYAFATRTRTDHRRLVFQSLATSRREKAVPYGRRLARAVEACKANASERGHEVEASELGINFDGGGDEMYHDVLDVLASTQPYVPPGFALESRDEFRGLATTLHHGAPNLFDLVVPADRLETFLSLLVATNFVEDVLDADTELRAVARDMAASFCQSDFVEGVTWPMFDLAVAGLLPHAFDPLYDLLGKVFFNSLCPLDANTGYLPVAEEGAVLTLPRMAQLEGFLFNSICMAEIRHVQTYTRAVRKTTADLVEHVMSISESGLLIISGRTATSTCIFGAFVSPKLLDGRCIRDGGAAFEETVLLFQLSPVHDVFRGRIGALAWSESDDGVVFGNQLHGVALTVDKLMRNARFTHHPSEDARETAYRATEHRGGFEMAFTVDEVELWEYDLMTARERKSSS